MVSARWRGDAAALAAFMRTSAKSTEAQTDVAPAAGVRARARRTGDWGRVLLAMPIAAFESTCRRAEPASAHMRVPRRSTRCMSCTARD
eukprot:5281026-Pleurochrysis_carterae.AAC.2